MSETVTGRGFGRFRLICDGYGPFSGLCVSLGFWIYVFDVGNACRVRFWTLPPNLWWLRPV